MSDKFAANAHEDFGRAVNFLTRKRAQEAREQDERGYLFPLKHSGGEAHVRRLSLAEVSTLTNLSTAMQATVLEIFQSKDEKGDVLTWEELKGNVKRQQELARGVAVAAFITPRLTETKEEADLANDDTVIWVDEIDPRDRVAFLQTVISPESEAAKLMAPFPAARLESIGSAGALPAAVFPVPEDAFAGGPGV